MHGAPLGCEGFGVTRVDKPVALALPDRKPRPGAWVTRWRRRPTDSFRENPPACEPVRAAHAQQRRGATIGCADRHARNHGPGRESRWIDRQHRRRHSGAGGEANDENPALVGFVAANRGAHHLPDRRRLTAAPADIARLKPIETTAALVLARSFAQATEAPRQCAGRERSNPN